MKDPICKGGGCYMFAADTPERAGCEKACRLYAPHLAAANDQRELRSSPEVVMYDINNDRHVTLSGRVSASQGPEVQRVPSTTCDESVAAVLRGKLPKIFARMGAFHDEGVIDPRDFSDFAELEKRLVAGILGP